MNVYIHIPFCRQKCPYCKFALTPVFDATKKRRYLAHLKKEIEKFFREHPLTIVDTLYFGWGTPSVLSQREVSDILSCFWETLSDTCEISFESNPEDIASEYVAWLFDLGITRLSLGIQSLSDTTLRAIHRSDRESIFRALDSIGSIIWWIQKNNNPNISINIDFILGLPYSEPWETLANIRELHERYPYITHTSAYMLEDGLYPKEWKWQSLSETEIESEYALILAYFDSINWHHYEISNWALPGYECRHNQWYWDHTDTRGFGLSATSYMDGVRTENSHSFSGYYRGDIESREVLNRDELELEQMIHDLRTFRLDASLYDEKIIEKYRSCGYMDIIDSKIILTSSWIFRENTILSELIAPP